MNRHAIKVKLAKVLSNARIKLVPGMLDRLTDRVLRDSELIDILSDVEDDDKRFARMLKRAVAKLESGAEGLISKLLEAEDG